ncbi:MAG: membrane protein insertase YidC [Gammaproteobacteria bacterium]|nr:membrane protein insertase YidC [Gammaproteobacteria bacterium]
MKKYIRYLLYGILIFIAILLWNVWQQEHLNSAKNNSSLSQPQNQQIPQTSEDVKPIKISYLRTVPQENLISIHTDVFDIDIDKTGGDIVKVALLEYPKREKDKEPLVLLNYDPKSFYISQSGIYRSNGFRSKKDLLQYQSEANSYTFNKDDNILTVKLKAKNEDGLDITKTYTFKPGEYLIDVDYQINNQTGKDWKGRYYAQFNQIAQEPERGFLNIHPFEGIAILDSKGDYKRYTFEKLKKEPLDESAQNGWLAMSQRYFVSAWVPNQNVIYRYYSQTENGKFYVAGLVSPRIFVNAGNRVDVKSKVYIGPKIAENLEHVAPKLDLTVDYSSFALLSLLASWLFKILKFINGIVGNWGWSIILITILIKLVFYHLSTKSYKSMAAMKKLQPKMEMIKNRYKDNPQERNKAMMELYQKEKINPLGGCLPILVQIPVFIALYYVLLQSVELRQAPFILWIHDLSVKDPYYILPILMGISMWVQQKLTPAPPDPTQAKMMMLLPVFLTVLFLNFPAGLVLYWLVNNILSVLQQWYIGKYYQTDRPQKKHVKK